MPARIHSSDLRPAHGVEYIVLRSALGAEHHLQVPVADPSARQKHIDEAITMLEANDQQMIDYAKTHGLPVPPEESAS